MFDWADYLRLAQELAQRGEESCKRSAVSRAYYSVFNLARRWFFHNDQAIYWSLARSGRIHDEL